MLLCWNLLVIYSNINKHCPCHTKDHTDNKSAIFVHALLPHILSHVTTFVTLYLNTKCKTKSMTNNNCYFIAIFTKILVFHFRNYSLENTGRMTVAQKCTSYNGNCWHMVALYTIPLKPNSNLHLLKNIKHILFLQCTLQIKYHKSQWSYFQEWRNEVNPLKLKTT